MKKTLTYLMLVLSTVFWGVSFIMTKELFLTEGGMTVTILITLRLAVATVVFIPSLAMLGKLQRVRREDIKWFLLLALAEPFVYNLCETSGVQLVSGSLASVVIATIPLFVPFGMALAYKERIGASTLAGVAMSMVGIAIMLIGGEELRGSWQGMLFLAAAVFIAVVYTLILVKIVDHYRPVTITAYQNLIGLVFYLPLMLAVDGSHLSQLSFSPKMILLLLALGVCCSTLAYVFYNYGVRQLGASAACVFNNAIPVFSLIAAIAIGQEHFAWSKVVGAAVVIGGVFLAQRGAVSRNSVNTSKSEINVNHTQPAENQEVR
ncbi:MAG: DMT family transporter [Bacteroidales bacterium]|nr:DMT family transporter [Bacteroidales bacterium]